MKSLKFCQRCGKTLHTHQYKYCSRKCNGDALINTNNVIEKTKQCLWCKETISKKQTESWFSWKSRKYCNKECHAEAQKWVSKNVGEKNGQWKGENASYRTIHERISRTLGQPKKCEICGTKNSKVFDWANMSGKYHDVNDYVRMCRKCHANYHQQLKREEKHENSRISMFGGVNAL